MREKTVFPNRAEFMQPTNQPHLGFFCHLEAKSTFVSDNRGERRDHKVIRLFHSLLGFSGASAFSVCSAVKFNYTPGKNEIKSEVENTFTFDCFLNAFSSDQIGALKDRAKAKYGSSLWTSLPCGDIFSASDRDSSYFSAGYISIIFLSKSENKNINASSLILAKFLIRSLSSINSSKAKSGVINSQPIRGNLLIKRLLADFSLKKENRILALTTKIEGSLAFICAHKPCLLATRSLSSSPSFKAISSVSLLSFSNSSASLNISSSDNCSFNASQTILLNSSSPSILAPTSNSFGTSTFISAISITYDNIGNEYINNFDLMGISCSQRSEGDLSLFVSSNPDYYGLGERGSLNMSLAQNQSQKEARFGLLRDENLSTLMTENLSCLFSADNPASMTDFPELHISEVMNSEII